ncbi:MAG: hypothetical protein V4727_10200 [Verrucomicrobiota bacterium]
MQLYAWANMLVTYSQETSISEAVVDTFSGEKPCHLCDKISEAKSSAPDNDEPKPIQLSQKTFPDLFTPTLVGLHDPFSSPLPPITFPAVADAHDRAATGPLAPPPRA